MPNYILDFETCMCSDRTTCITYHGRETTNMHFELIILTTEDFVSFDFKLIAKCMWKHIGRLNGCERKDIASESPYGRKRGNSPNRERNFKNLKVD